MRIIKCDRCQKDISKQQHIGYVNADWADPVTGELEGNRAFEGWDFCEDCMKEITDFVRMKPALPKSGGGTVKQETKIDTGKIKALAKAGWTTKQIAEEIGCSLPTVRKYLDNKEE